MIEICWGVSMAFVFLVLWVDHRRRRLLHEERNQLRNEAEDLRLQLAELDAKLDAKLEELYRQQANLRQLLKLFREEGR